MTTGTHTQRAVVRLSCGHLKTLAVGGLVDGDELPCWSSCSPHTLRRVSGPVATIDHGPEGAVTIVWAEPPRSALNARVVTDAMARLFACVQLDGDRRIVATHPVDSTRPLPIEFWCLLWRTETC